MTLVGLISDTHGLLRPAVVAALSGVDRILHAGDVGKPEILDELRAIAPVTAVRGNVDTGTGRKAFQSVPPCRLKASTFTSCIACTLWILIPRRRK